MPVESEFVNCVEYLVWLVYHYSRDVCLTGVADTYISLALCASSEEEKMEHFKEAEAIVGSDGSSTEHTTIGRLYMNLGIFYENKNCYREARENYEKYLHNSTRLFGQFHPETKRAQKAVSRYVWFITTAD